MVGKSQISFEEKDFARVLTFLETIDIQKENNNKKKENRLFSCLPLLFDFARSLLLKDSSFSLFHILMIIMYFLVPEMYIVFAMTTEAGMAEKTYKIMTDTVKNLGDKFGIRKMHFSIVIFGIEKPLFDFDNTIPDQESLVKKVNSTPKPKKEISFDSTMKVVEKVFNSSAVKVNSKKVLVVMTHKKFGVNSTVIYDAFKPLNEERVIPIVVKAGDDVNQNEIEGIARTERKIVEPTADDSGRQVADEIIKAVMGGNYINIVW